ncbi:MAG: hypothetical protein AAB581_03030, partial [Patescibacteria group bacterium]
FTGWSGGGCSGTGGCSVTMNSNQTVTASFSSAFVDCGLKMYDGTQIVTAACEPSGTVTSLLRTYNRSQIWGIVLVDLGDPMASDVRIQTPSGVKALRRQ